MRRQLKWDRLRGESLLEVVVAVTFLTVVFASIFSVLIRASATNTNVVNRVVAINIAREGMEAVRNIRDTNWLKYSGDRRGKWLCLDTIDETLLPSPLTHLDNIKTLSACSSGIVSASMNFIKTEDGVYRVAFSSAGRYLLEPTGETLTENKILPEEEFRLHQDINGRFSHDNTGEILPFYRQIKLVPETRALATDPCDPDTESCPQDVRLRVLVRVQWIEGNSVRSIDLETYLYDFLGRDSY